MTIITNIGNFANWFSVECEMKNEEIKSIKIEDALCIANVIHLGSVAEELSLEEVKELASKEYR